MGVICFLTNELGFNVFYKTMTLNSFNNTFNCLRTDVLTIKSCITCTVAKTRIRISEFTRTFIASSLIKESL